MEVHPVGTPDFASPSAPMVHSVLSRNGLPNQDKVHEQALVGNDPTQEVAFPIGSYLANRQTHDEPCKASIVPGDLPNYVFIYGTPVHIQSWNSYKETGEIPPELMLSSEEIYSLLLHTPFDDLTHFIGNNTYEGKCEWLIKSADCRIDGLIELQKVHPDPINEARIALEIQTRNKVHEAKHNRPKDVTKFFEELGEKFNKAWKSLVREQIKQGIHEVLNKNNLYDILTKWIEESKAPKNDATTRLYLKPLKIKLNELLEQATALEVLDLEHQVLSELREFNIRSDQYMYYWLVDLDPKVDQAAEQVPVHVPVQQDEDPNYAWLHYQGEKRDD